MNYKKSYKSANGYTKICKIGECSLKKLEFGIIELNPGQKLDFFTEDKETAFIMLEGHCNVSAGDEFLRMSATGQTFLKTAGRKASICRVTRS